MDVRCLEITGLRRQHGRSVASIPLVVTDIRDQTSKKRKMYTWYAQSCSGAPGMSYYYTTTTTVVYPLHRRSHTAYIHPSRVHGQTIARNPVSTKSSISHLFEVFVYTYYKYRSTNAVIIRVYTMRVSSVPTN